MFAIHDGSQTDFHWFDGSRSRFPTSFAGSTVFFPSVWLETIQPSTDSSPHFEASVDEAGHVVLAAGGTFPLQVKDIFEDQHLQLETYQLLSSVGICLDFELKMW